MPKDRWRSPRNAKGIFSAKSRVVDLFGLPNRPTPGLSTSSHLFHIPYWLSESGIATIVRLPGFPNTAAYGPETSDKAQSCSVKTPSVVSTKGQKPMTGYFQN